MFVEINGHTSFDDWLMTIGHELCHSFEDTQGIGLTSADTNEENLDEWVEELCEEFSRRWLRTGTNYHEIRELFIEHFIRRRARTIWLDRC